jgi:Heterokaryon incompatibility protein (HET)
MAKLCQWCKQINFAAILTPREYDLDSGTNGPIYRKEYTGDGLCPTVESKKWGKIVRTGPPESYLPQIRTAHYDDLVSNSARSESSVGELSVGHASEDDVASGSVDPDGETNDEGSEVDGSTHGDSESDDEAAPEWLSMGEERPQSESDFEDCRDPLQAAWTTEEVSEEPHPANENFEQDKSDQERLELLDDEAPVDSRQSVPKVEDHIQRPYGSVDGKIDMTKDPSQAEMSPEVNEADAKSHLPIKDRVAKFGIPIHSRRDNSLNDSPTRDDDLSDSATSASTWSYFSHFTELERIDLEKQATGKWEYKRKQLYYFGTIWDVYSRRHVCDLCSYFWRRMRSDIVVKRGFITKSRCVLKCVEFKCKSIDEPEKRQISMLNMLAIYCYKFGDPGEKAWNVRVPFVLQGRHRTLKVPPLSVWDGSRPFRDDLFGEARLREDICDTSLFCQWLSFCETNHKHPKYQATGELNFRLIDLYDSCLVEWKGPATQLPRYFVLSYIWGTSRQRVMLNRENYSRLHQKGVINKLNFNNTIRDALELVQEMGERYVWIDALCIIQDDGEDKTAQIPQMHLIYGLATLTIIAAFGDDADAGLPGIQPESRNGSKILLQLEDISLLLRSATQVFHTHDDIGFVENYLWKSKYSSRGWTFQEALLSTRALIFTRKQVYWECPTCTWCEETHWESKTLAYVGQRGVIDPTPQDIWEDNFDRRAYGGPGETTGEFQRNSYPNLVRAYSQRQLTDEGDILNAFAGVLSSIETREKTRFLYALRERHFGNDLLWGWDNLSAPRLNTKFAGGRASVTGTPWPSWSWLAWKGVVDIPNEPRHNSYDPTENIEPSDGVRCYIMELVGEEKRLRSVNENGGWRFHEGYAKRGGGIFDPTWFHRAPPANSESETADSSQQEVPVNELNEGESSLSLEDEELSIEQGELAKETSGHLGGQYSRPSLKTRKETNSKPSKVREMPQDISLNDLEALPLFQNIRPNFHIFFYTWSTPVVLRTNGRQRGLYIDNGSDEDVYYGYIMNGMHQQLPENVPMVPDGRYEALHMNNNQNASFGHMLIRWDNGMARRICMCIGPLEIWEEKYCSKWKLIILG